MRYLLMIHTDEVAYAGRPPEAVTAGNAAYAAYTEALKKAGTWMEMARRSTVVPASFATELAPV